MVAVQAGWFLSSPGSDPWFGGVGGFDDSCMFRSRVAPDVDTIPPYIDTAYKYAHILTYNYCFGICAHSYT